MSSLKEIKITLKEEWKGRNVDVVYMGVGRLIESRAPVELPLCLAEDGMKIYYDENTVEGFPIKVAYMYFAQEPFEVDYDKHKKDSSRAKTS